jgi:hypothetical protein
MKNLKKESKENLKEVKKSFNELSDEQILAMNLDELNLNDFKSLIESKKEKISQSSKIKMYKIDVDKKIRKKLRDKRNRLCNNINIYYKDDKKELLQNEIKLFNEFYKTNYTLNDFSLLSIASTNSDKDTKVKLSIALKIIKDNK